MTNEEAMRNLKQKLLNTDMPNTIRVAISAIEKQIPKKIGVDGYGWYECPDCHNKRPNWLLGKDAKWCPYCGQRIDWTEGEEA